MNTLPAQELKRRGLAAVDDAIARGDLHLIRKRRPHYVVLSADRYQSLLEAQDEAYLARMHASLQDLQTGRVHRFSSTEALLQVLDADD
ncbi:MAG: prevent-host-death protein [Ardenticatenia bacterium]|nr:prevent-host-death protein [Ardenticatenia bacterium]